MKKKKKNRSKTNRIRIHTSICVLLTYNNTWRIAAYATQISGSILEKRKINYSMLKTMCARKTDVKRAKAKTLHDRTWRVEMIIMTFWYGKGKEIYTHKTIHTYIGITKYFISNCTQFIFPTFRCVWFTARMTIHRTNHEWKMRRNETYKANVLCFTRKIDLPFLLCMSSHIKWIFSVNVRARKVCLTLRSQNSAYFQWLILLYDIFFDIDRLEIFFFFAV